MARPLTDTELHEILAGVRQLCDVIEYRHPQWRNRMSDHLAEHDGYGHGRRYDGSTHSGGTWSDTVVEAVAAIVDLGTDVPNTNIERRITFVRDSITAIPAVLRDIDEAMRADLEVRNTARDAAAEIVRRNVCTGLRGDENGCPEHNVASKHLRENIDTGVDSYDYDLCDPCWERSCRTCRVRPKAEHRKVCETCRKREQRAA